MIDLKTLVYGVRRRKGLWVTFKAIAVNRLTTGAVALGEVSTLYHKVLDDTMEGGALVVKRFAGLALSFLSCEQVSLYWKVGSPLHIPLLYSPATLHTSTESTKVFSRLGHNVVVQLEYYSPFLHLLLVHYYSDWSLSLTFLATNCDIKEAAFALVFGRHQLSYDVPGCFFFIQLP